MRIARLTPAASRPRSRAPAAAAASNDTRPFAAGEDHTERVEQDQLGVIPHGLGNVLAPRLRNKPRQFFNLLAQENALSFREANCMRGAWRSRAGVGATRLRRRGIFPIYR